MKFIYFVIVFFIVFAVAAWWMAAPEPQSAVDTGTDTEDSVSTEADELELDPVIVEHIDSKEDLIRVESPQPLETIGQPLTIAGEARGYWFFEASFPIILTDWDGRIIAEHYATADDDWMTEDFVSFTATIEYESPYQAGDPDFMQRGTLILQKQNASGLPENADALEFPILFSSPETE